MEEGKKDGGGREMGKEGRTTYLGRIEKKCKYEDKRQFIIGGDNFEKSQLSFIRLHPYYNNTSSTSTFPI